LSTELRTTDGTKIEFAGLSRNKGVVWVNWKGIHTHILLTDLDEESRQKVESMLSEALKEESQKIKNP
jgi:hypothetical protein